MHVLCSCHVPNTWTCVHNCAHEYRMSTSSCTGEARERLSAMSSSSEELLESSTTMESDSDSNVSDLYASFEFEEVVDSHLSQTVECAESPTTQALSGAGGLLCPGAQLSTFQSHLLIFQYAIHHGLTNKAFKELLQLLSVHAPSGACVPKSVHILKQEFMVAFPEAKAEEHLYCSLCQRSMSSRVQGCTGEGCTEGCPAVFITVPLRPQVKRMMEGMHDILLQ